MKPYLLALGLALAGEARADEPKECIDKIVLDIQIDKVPDDPLSFAYHNSSAESRLRLERNLLRPVQDIYQTDIGIPVEARFGQIDHNANRISVRYTSVKQLLPDVEAFKTFVANAVNANDQVLKDVDAILQRHTPSEQERLYPLVLDVMKAEYYNLDGLTIGNEIFLFSKFSEPNIRDYLQTLDEYATLDKIMTITGTVLAHEVGHILLRPKKDSKERMLDTQHYDLMYERTDPPAALSKNYALSKEDKAKILSQVCKPEETK